MTVIPIRVGISSCLLGHQVRYDGGHKRVESLVNGLSCHVEWVPICPEVEAGLGIPREPMRLVTSGSNIRVITIETREDQTDQLTQFSARRVSELKTLHLSGFVLKARSPSCGIEQVPVYDEWGKRILGGMGLFASAVRNAFPAIPVVHEEHLADPAGRELFLTQVVEYHQTFVVQRQNTHRCRS